MLGNAALCAGDDPKRLFAFGKKTIEGQNTPECYQDGTSNSGKISFTNAADCVFK